MFANRLPGLLLAILVTLPQIAGAQDDDDDENGSEDFADLIEDATFRPGFFDTYEKDEHLYLVIPDGRIGQDFLLSMEVARGIGSGGLTGGLMMNIFDADIVALERHGSKVYLVHKPHRYVANAGSPEEDALSLTFGSSVLASASIDASPGDSAIVIDTYDWFVSDLSGVGQIVNDVVSTKPDKPGSASFDKGRSHLESVKGFEDNLNVQAKLTFKPSKPVSIRGVADSRYIPVSIHYSLFGLPDVPMEAREADDRVGFFTTVHKDFSDDGRTFLKRYVHKWRLECDGPADSDGLCTPVKPITYYIDKTVPLPYRQAMMDGVEAFVPAFESAGFRNGIRAALLPDSVDAENIRYATLRWNTSDLPGWGAIGPSTVDPRTGEILDADILFEANMILGWKNIYRVLVDPSAILESMLFAEPDELKTLASGGEMSSFGTQMLLQSGLVQASLTASGSLKPGEPVPDAFINDALKWVTMHEVGHTLGLRHNFRSSTDTPLDKLHDRSWTEDNGVFSSVMEYPTVNIASDGSQGGEYYNSGVGTYDKWAISYGYTPDASRAAELARLSAAPGHAYGTDEDARGPGAIDPTVNVFDLGADPLEWARGRAALVKTLWPEIAEISLADNEPYFEATTALALLLANYVSAVSTGVKYIGGQYQSRDHFGDPDGRPPFSPVSVERQREALDFIVESMFDSDAFFFEPAVLQSLGAYRWSDWGSRLTINDRVDYPLHEQINNVQRTVLRRITSPFVFARILDAERKYGADQVLGIPALMNTLSNAIWAEAWTAPGRNVEASRRNLQRAHIDRLTLIVIDAPDRTPADARAVARLTLEDLHERLSRRLSPPANFDDYTLAHYKESMARIGHALEAGLELEN